MTMIPPIPPSDDGREGKRRRDEALGRLRGHRAAVVRLLQRAAVRIALDAGTVTADDVRALLSIPADMSPKLVGCAFRDLADAHLVRRIGYRPSVRAVAHARPLSVWQLADAAAAVAWLASNPPIVNGEGGE
jgi:hypothetical protein